MKTIGYSFNKKRGWRVVVPADLSGSGKASDRFFKDKADAKNFVTDLNYQRGSSASHLLALSPQVQEAVLRAVRTMDGHSAEIDLAATEYMQRQHQRPKQVITVRKLIEECLASKRKAKRITTTTEKKMSSSLKAFALKFGERRAHEVATKEIEEWLHSVAGWGDFTKRGHLINVRTAFSYAVKHKYCPENPATNVETPQCMAPKTIFTVAQCRQLMSAAMRDPGVALHLASRLFGGIRPFEDARLLKSDVKLNREHEHIELNEEVTKTTSRRLVTITPVYKAWLDMFNQKENWPKVRDLPIESFLPDFKARLERVIEAAGLRWAHDVLRHTFISHHVAAFGNINDTALQSGNSVQIIKQSYLQLVDKEQGRLFFSDLLTPEGVLFYVPDSKDITAVAYHKKRRRQITEGRADLVDNVTVLENKRRWARSEKGRTWEKAYRARPEVHARILEQKRLYRLHNKERLNAARRKQPADNAAAAAA